MEMNKMKYEVSPELMQKILDYIGGSSSNQPVVKIIQLVDEIRALKPIKIKSEAKEDAEG
jgi:hypothetical protein